MAQETIRIHASIESALLLWLQAVATACKPRLTFILDSRRERSTCRCVYFYLFDAAVDEFNVTLYLWQQDTSDLCDSTKSLSDSIQTHKSDTYKKGGGEMDRKWVVLYI